ncbi:type 1 glutamine amidotransferase [Halorhabdus tiamatea]|nr:type 1 glutamine amidotransferase [Halorhabdus tiamatea]CCQ32561.1 GMP synthase [Halorhabdus tiamatea SARL4B]
MDEPSLALLDASIGSTPAADNFRRVLDVPVSTYKVSEGELPPEPADDGRGHDGVVISGSQVAVYEDRRWIEAVEAWIDQAVEADVPVLGVCWGHQLLASALGGRVEATGAYELGYSTVERVRVSALFEGVGESFVAFESHSDAVSELPAGATRLAENGRGVQAFAVGDAYGVQFHPEYDVETARWVVQNKEGEIDADRLESVLASITPENHARTADARQVFGNFEAIVTESE